MLKRWAMGCVLWAVSVTPALAQVHDDEDTPDDLEFADFTDDGEPVGDAPPEAVCNLEPPVDIYLEWTLDGDAEFTLPPAGAGNTWTIEYRARSRDFDLAWVETGQGSPTTEVVEVLTLPTSVSAAATTTPLALTARASARDATDTEVDMRYPKWLILDARSGTMQYERWEDHVWPTITNAAGEVFPIAELDWDPDTAIRTTIDENDEGTLFPEDRDLAALLDPCPQVQSVTFCVDLQVDFVHSARSAVGRQDYFDTNADKYARGHKVWASGPATCGRLFDHASWESTGSLPPGCVTLDLDPYGAYDIWVASDIRVSGSAAWVSETQGPWPSGVWSARVRKSFVPAFSITHPVEVRTPEPNQGWNVSSVTAWGMYRRYIQDFIVRIYTDEPCPGQGGTCASGNRVFLEGYEDWRETFVIAHEIGHVVGFMTDDSRSPNKSYSEVGGGSSKCASDTDNHLIPSKEYASAAAIEGFADYWAAVVFNNTKQPGCLIDWYTQDFSGDDFRDGDNGDNAVPSWQPFSCQGMPYGGTTMLDPTYTETASDHLGNVCDGTLANRGTEYDWMRMFWDLDDGLSFSTILEVWDRADPKDWRKTDSGTSDRPWERIRDAANIVSPYVHTRFVDEGAIHGTDRL